MAHTGEVSRREARIYVSLPITLRTGWEGATVVKASTVDYSEHGLRVRAEAALRVRQEVEVLHDADPPAFRGAYLVVWVREAGDGMPFLEAGLFRRGMNAEVRPNRPYSPFPK